MEKIVFFVKKIHILLIFYIPCGIIEKKEDAMRNSICKFLPAKHRDYDIKALRFIYETEIRELRQPFIYPVYLCALVVRGAGTLYVGDDGIARPLQEGSLFFAFPALSFEIRDLSYDFEYVYISFMGSGVPELLGQFDISRERCVFPGLACLVPIFAESVRRINLKNANVLAEGVLLYALSYLSNGEGDTVLKKSHENVFSAVVDHVEKHYRDQSLTLKRVAEVFSYTDKYLSALFKRSMGIGFNSYLADLRISYANELISSGISSVSEIARLSGFRDPLYFSKLYRKKTGKTPTEAIGAVGVLSKYVF